KRRLQASFPLEKGCGHGARRSYRPVPNRRSSFRRGEGGEKSGGGLRRPRIPADRWETLPQWNVPDGFGSPAGGDGDLRSQPAWLRLRRDEQPQLRTDPPGARARRLRVALLRVGPDLAEHVSDLQLGQRRAEGALSAGDGQGKNPGLLRSHRIRFRIGS